MKDFHRWLRENATTPRVVITTDNLQQVLLGCADKLLDGERERLYQASVFEPEEFLQQMQEMLGNLKYPFTKNMMRSLASRNAHYVIDQLDKLRKWTTEQRLLYQVERDLRELQMSCWTYLDHFRPRSDIETVESQIQKGVQEAIEQTQQEMEKIKVLIEGAISRIANWNGTQVTIEAQPAENEYGPMLQSNDSAYVTVGDGEYSPSFSFFQFDANFELKRGNWVQKENPVPGAKRIEIDDVVEGGDDDFFRTPQIQADYFNLVNELRNPGSTNRGRVLTLYTARPVVDRQRFLTQRTLPVNAFLTNNYDHVEGLAMDLGGSQGTRDIWKVRIDSRYLTLTLDGPIKYYQVTSPDAQTLGMELIYTSNSNPDTYKIDPNVVRQVPIAQNQLGKDQQDDSGNSRQ